MSQDCIIALQHGQEERNSVSKPKPKQKKKLHPSAKFKNELKITSANKDIKLALFEEY